MAVKTPWEDSMGEVPMHLDYFDGTMFEMLEQTAQTCPDMPALVFLGKTTTYRRLVEKTECCARALRQLGIGEGDRVTIALPNCPQAVCMFYAVNLVGGLANMVHPLSAEQEIETCIRESDSVAAIALDQCYCKFSRIPQHENPIHLILTGIRDEMPPLIRAVCRLKDGRTPETVPKQAPILLWRDFLRMGRSCIRLYPVGRKSEDPAVILYSGGTTGTTKGVVLTNGNFNALSRQIVAANPMYRPGDTMLAAMPMFHGFGLGVCIHTMLTQGGCCILVPRFTPKEFLRCMVKYRCNFVAGVPTLYESLLRLQGTERVDLSCLKGVFSGGDSLPAELKKKIDRFLLEHNASVSVREGYGTTETVTACCLTPMHSEKEGSIGVPFPDTYVKIVCPDTEEEVPYGETGEILLAGPTVMKEYLNNPEETAQTLHNHDDGQVWVRTGDLGMMDEQGFLYFKGRAKRMIVTSGYNVYPSQIEQVLDAHELVQMSCVIGVPDPHKMQRVKAFVELAPGAQTENAGQILLEYCRKRIAHYAVPCEIEVRRELPKTSIGKVAYRILETQAGNSTE